MRNSYKYLVLLFASLFLQQQSFSYELSSKSEFDDYKVEGQLHIDKNLKEVLSLSKKAERLYFSGKSRKAIKTLKSALAKLDDIKIENRESKDLLHVRLLAKLMFIQFGIADNKKAIKNSEKALLICDENSRTPAWVNVESKILFGQARYFRRIDELQNSEKTAEKIIEIADKSLTNDGTIKCDVAGAYNLLGEISAENKRYEQACRYYEKSIELIDLILHKDSNNKLGTFTKIHVLWNIGELNKHKLPNIAKQKFRDAICLSNYYLTLDTKNIDAYHMQAIARFYAADSRCFEESILLYDDAIKILDKAIDLMPNYVVSSHLKAFGYYKKGVYLLESGQIPKALDCLNASKDICSKYLSVKSPRFKRLNISVKQSLKIAKVRLKSN